MKRMFCLSLIIFLLLPIIGMADFELVPTDYSTEMLNMFDDYPEYYLNNANEMVGLMAYEVSIDISTLYPNYSISLEENIFFGIARQNNEVAMFFVYPIAKKQNNSKQKYNVAYYNISTQSLFYDPKFELGISQVYTMMSGTCGDLYIQVSSYDIAKALDLLDQVLLYNWEEPRSPSLDFMKGKRPVDWSSYFSEKNN